jgi:hypothetical protein
MIPTAVLFLGALFSILALKSLPLAYLWIAICWTALLAFLTWQSKESKFKFVWYNLAFFAFLFGVLELHSYLSLAKDRTRYEGEYHKRGAYFTDHELLGYAPAKGATVGSKKYRGGKLIYDVVYTINDLGLRVSSPVRSPNLDRCVLFFGDSFTFGEGVNDQEAMPYVVGKLSDYKIYNFGFHGYGPHQMLSAIEHGMVAKIVDCRPGVAIYQALPTHAARAAGYDLWNRQAPKYILTNDGVRYDGQFTDYPGTNERLRMQRKLVGQLRKSYFYRNYFRGRSIIRDNDVRRFVEIMDASRKKLAEQYPRINFHVILWPENSSDDTPGTFEAMRAGLIARGFKVHLITDILPDRMDHASRYILSRYDAHPNALAHAKIAEYVVKHIISNHAVD